MRVFKIRAESKCAFTFSMRQIALHGYMSPF
jgi:hypothetical protein